MDLEFFDRSYLLEQFREFYGAVLAGKQEVEARALRKSQGRSGGGTQMLPTIAGPGGDEINLDDLAEGIEEINEGGAGESEIVLAERLRSELAAVIQRQAQAVLRRGDEREQRRFREIQYIMAAAADEEFLNLAWDGRDYWGQNLLEEELFHTHNAGEQFFVTLDDLLRQRDPTRAEVMAAYLLALSLGFRGKYRDIEGEGRLEYFRQQLFATLFQRNPGLSPDSALFPQAYAHIAVGKSVQWLPRLRPWLIGMGGVVLGYLAISHIVWETESGRVSNTIERLREIRMEKASKAAPAPRVVQKVQAAPAASSADKSAAGAGGEKAAPAPAPAPQPPK